MSLKLTMAFTLNYVSYNIHTLFGVRMAQLWVVKDYLVS